MNENAPLENISIYQSNSPLISHQEILELIKRESRYKYPHLNPCFYPDHCMQAKINIKTAGHSLLHPTPDIYINILKSENFFPEFFKHRLPQCDSSKDCHKYVLINKEMEKIGYKFVMKATFGPSFISIWFRNESENERIDLPVFYALEILNKISDKINHIDENMLPTHKQQGTIKTNRTA
ncbi:MAG: hypothetical protein V3T17_19525, partial [Pseudomonadales bacterium]